MDLNTFMNTEVADAPDASLYATGAKVRFKITRTTPRTVGEDQKNQIIVRLRPVSIEAWPENGEYPAPTDIKTLEPVDMRFMLTTLALTNTSPHISAKKFIQVLGVEFNQSWKAAWEQTLGKEFVGLVRRKNKYGSQEETEPVVQAVIVD